MRPERLELPTLGSEDRCSIQLSYGRSASIFSYLTSTAQGSIAFGDVLGFSMAFTDERALIDELPGSASRVSRLPSPRLVRESGAPLAIPGI